MGWARGYPLYLPPPPRPKHYAPHMGICLGRRGGGRRSRAVDGGGAVVERARWAVSERSRALASPALPHPRAPRALAPARSPSCSSARAPLAPPRPRVPARALPRPAPPARPSARARPVPPRQRAPARAPPAPPARAPHPSPILFVEVHVKWSVCCKFFSGS